MKVSNNFEKAISAFIEKEKIGNPDFLEATKKEDRNIEECCNYILNKVKKLGHNAMADDEVFDIVTEYYFAQEIEKPKPIKAKVSTGPSIGNAEVKRKKEEAAKPPVPKEKTPAELLIEEGITEELLKTISTATHGTKIIMKPGLPVYSLLKTKDHFFVYDENDSILKDEKFNNIKITNKEGMIGLARYVLSIKK